MGIIWYIPYQYHQPYLRLYGLVQAVVLKRNVAVESMVMTWARSLSWEVQPLIDEGPTLQRHLHGNSPEAKARAT